MSTIFFINVFYSANISVACAEAVVRRAAATLCRAGVVDVSVIIVAIFVDGDSSGAEKVVFSVARRIFFPLVTGRNVFMVLMFWYKRMRLLSYCFKRCA